MPTIKEDYAQGILDEIGWMFNRPEGEDSICVTEQRMDGNNHWVVPTMERAERIVQKLELRGRHGFVEDQHGQLLYHF